MQKLVALGADMKVAVEQLIHHVHHLLLVYYGVSEGSEVDLANLKALKNPQTQLKDLLMLFAKASSETKYAVLPQLPLELAIVEWGLFKEDAKDKLEEKHEENGAGGNVKAVVKSFHPVGFEKKSVLWNELIEKVKKKNFSVAGILRGCVLQAFDGKEMIIATSYKFHKERLDTEAARALIESVGSEIAGKNIKVSIVLTESK